jgi:hypothetical protein
MNHEVVTAVPSINFIATTAMNLQECVASLEDKKFRKPL